MVAKHEVVVSSTLSKVSTQKDAISDMQMSRSSEKSHFGKRSFKKLLKKHIKEKIIFKPLKASD